MLISLEHFKGIVIFATNLVVNYDKAFLSRLINIEFTLPDAAARKKIWANHLTGYGVKIPLARDVNCEELAQRFEFSGREIKNSVKDACVTVALNGGNLVMQKDLMKAAEKAKVEYDKVIKAEDHTASHSITPSEKSALNDAIKNSVANAKNTTSIQKC